MQFSIVDTLAHPVADVYAVTRDRLTELVPYLPDIRRIECRERTDLPDGTVRIVNHWHASTQIPAAFRKLVGSESVSWIDHAEWDPKRMSVRWRLEMMVFREYVDVRGENFYTGDAASTRVELNGTLAIDLARHPLVPRLLAGSIGSQVEKFVLALVKPNLTSVNRGIEKYLVGRA